MLKPAPLADNAVIGVVAPASPVKRDLVDKGVAALERLGLAVRLGPHLFERGRYCAGTAKQRADDFRELWSDPEVSAIFCARGGYGSMDLLPLLTDLRVEDDPKPLLGCSDPTALLAWLGTRGIVSFHGPMVAQDMARGTHDQAQLLSVLRGREGCGVIDAPAFEMLHSGAGEGVLLGGCLSMIVSLVGTPYLPSFDDAVLFLEDTLVKPYQIDRMLTQLRLSGRLDAVRGIVFGEMAGCEQHPDQGYRLEEMLRDWTAYLGVPVGFGLPSGHTTTHALTLPLGVRARLDHAGLHLLEGAVA